MNKFDPKQIVHSVTGDKPPFIKVVFPAPTLEVAGGGPMGGQTTEDYIRLRALPKDMQDRIVLYIKESMRG
jgi:hypothetical protein